MKFLQLIDFMELVCQSHEHMITILKKKKQSIEKSITSQTQKQELIYIR